YQLAVRLEGRRCQRLNSIVPSRYSSHWQFLTARTALRSSRSIVLRTASTFSTVGFVGPRRSIHSTRSVAAKVVGLTEPGPLMGVFFFNASQQCWSRCRYGVAVDGEQAPVTWST